MTFVYKTSSTNLGVLGSLLSLLCMAGRCCQARFPDDKD